MRVCLRIRGDCAKQVAPFPPYTLTDFVLDCKQNPGGVLEVGGSSEPDEFAVVEPRGDFAAEWRSSASGRVAIVAHSAAGGANSDLEYFRGF